jgi:hypothetical protein
MSLLVYNLTTAPLVLANGLSTTIPASTAGVGARGIPWYASGNELNGRSALEYTALQAQQDTLSKVAVAGSFAVAGVNVTMTDTTGAFIVNNIGQFISISGATSPANNGSFPVTAQTATTITYTNAAGVVEAYTGTYSLPGLVAFEWQAFQEYVTYPLLVASAQTDIADLDVEIFADPVAGDDSFPGTQTQPVQTFQRAWTLGAVLGRRKRRIYLAAGTYPCVSEGGKDTVFYVAPPLDEGEFLTVFGTPVDAGLGLLTAGPPPGPYTNQVSIAAHAPNSMIGATLRVVNNNGGGTAAGARCMIKADDGVILTLCNSLEWVSYGGNIAAGDQLVIERPGSILTTDTNFGFEGALCFKDVAVDATTGIGLIAFTDCKVQNALNLELRSKEVAIINNSQFSPSAIGLIFFDPPPFETFLESGGVYIHDAVEVIIEQGGRFQRTNAVSSAAVLFRDCPLIEVHESGVFSMVDGGAAFLNSAVMLDGSTCLFRMVGATDGVTEFSRATMDGSLGNALSMTSGAKAEFLSADISNAAGDAVNANGGCFVSAGDLGGSLNGGYGLNLQGSSLATADNAGAGLSACTVFGAAGEVLVGMSLQTYAGMAADLGFGETNAGGPTLNRFSVLP